MDFNRQLYQLRRTRGISQEELGNALGVSRQAVQKWEAGISRPDLDNLLALSDYFDVSLDELVRGSAQENHAAATEVHHYYWQPEYEYKSTRTLCGLPLVHIHFGYGLRRAKGILAIGNVATGIIALGGFSAGVCSLGGLSLGLLTLGGIAVGGCAAGGVAIGALALGGCALGRYAVGGAAYGACMAVGAAAGSNRVAIGLSTSGAAELKLSLELCQQSGLSPDLLIPEIQTVLPHTPEWLMRLLLRFGL